MSNRCFFYIVMMCVIPIIGENGVQELSIIDGPFTVYQAIVRHALLAWQRAENGIIDEKETLELIGRIALVKYFFEQAQENEQEKINDDSRFWTHVMDHILIHVHQAGLANHFLFYINETVNYVKKRCWNKN